MSARTWLLGYTCQAHRNIVSAVDTTDCACQPSLPLRLCWWLGLRFLEEVSPVHPLAAVPEPRWCTHTWPAPTDHGQPNEDHLCELPHGHGAPEHACDCGARDLTQQAAERLLRLVRLPASYDDCLWPEDDLCPRHDLKTAWPPGRDCLGTCTVCNSPANEWHAQSCPHYDADAMAEHDRLTRNHPDNRKA